MSEMPPDLRDGNLSSVYRAAPADEPPAALDDAIRAAARREVGSRPRSADKPFHVRWQMPLSAAAVLVLCVSLIAVMRDEGGELTRVPRADAPAPGADRAAEVASAVPKVELAPEASRAKSIGLKQPGDSANAPAVGADPYSLVAPGGGIGMRAPGTAPEEARRAAEPFAADAMPRRPVLPALKDKADLAAAEPAANNAVKSSAPREVAQAATVPETRGELQAKALPAEVSKRTEAVETGKSLRQQVAAADQLERDARPASPPAAAPAARVAAAPAARVAEKSGKETAGVVEEMTRMAPDKWIARIEELRQAGRLDEARAGLAEFRRRYPDFVLPAALRDGIQR